ncbi:hypothetical protein HPB47_011628, partial [Ixodes persulcatus]
GRCGAGVPRGGASSSGSVGQRWWRGGHGRPERAAGARLAWSASGPRDVATRRCRPENKCQDVLPPVHGLPVLARRAVRPGRGLQHPRRLRVPRPRGPVRGGEGEPGDPHAGADRAPALGDHGPVQRP